MTAQTTDSTAGGLGIGVVQPQSGLDYPFVSPGAGVQTLAVADVENLFADFYLSYDDVGYYKNQPIAKNPLRIYWLSGFGTGEPYTKGEPPNPAISIPAPAHAADLVIVDSDNRVIFDSTAADYFDEQTWGEYYTVYEWRKTTKPNEAVCRAVKYEKVHNNLELPERPSAYCPRNAVLDERTIEKIPKRVLAMRVQMGECVTPWFKNRVSFVNGHNTELEIGATTTNDLRRTTPITFKAEAGSGAGQYGLCPTGICEEDPETGVCPPGEDQVITICPDVVGQDIKSINGATPDNAGNLFLTANDCLWVRKPATYTGSTPHNYENVNGSPLRAVMAVGSDCAPCCACEDYVETAKYMSRLGLYYRDIGNRVTDIKTIHEENISRWELQRECRNKRPFELLLVPQPCPCMDVVLFYCNHCDTCAENVVLTVNFSAVPNTGSGVLDTKYTKMVSDGRSNTVSVSGGWPIFSVKFPTVDAGASVYAQFRLCFCPQYPYAIKGTLRGVSKAGPILAGCAQPAEPAVIEATQILDCEIPVAPA